MIWISTARLNKQIFDKLCRPKTTGYTDQMKTNSKSYKKKKNCNQTIQEEKTTGNEENCGTDQKENRVGTKETKKKKERDF